MIESTDLAAETHPGPAEQAKSGDESDVEKDRRKAAKRIFEGRQDAEKILLKWMRVGPALVGSGVALDRALAYVDLTGPTRLDPDHTLRFVAQSLVVLGIVALAVACIQYRKIIRALEQDAPLPDLRPHLALLVGGAMVVLSLVALVSILLAQNAQSAVVPNG